MSRALKLVGLVWIGLILILANYAAANADTQGRQKLHGHRTARMAAAPLAGEVADDRQFDLSVALPFRNTNQLQTFIQQISDPSSPLYRHYLTNEQFTEAYGPTAADYQAVVDYLKAKGLQVTAIHSNRMLVSVRANKSDIQKAFHVGMHNYKREDGSTFFGPDDEPSLDLDTPVLHIGGLNNYILPYPKMVVSNLIPNAQVVNSHSNAITSFAGSGPSGLLMGKDFRNAYVPGVSLTGSGQSVALFELDTYYPGDVQRYMSGAGLTNSITNVYLDGWSSSTTPGTGNGEVSLDIDQAMSMAPSSSEVCYMGPNIDDVLNRIATDNSCKQISSSWGWGPSSSTENQILQQYAAQGQSYFTASGDSGSFTTDPGGNEDDPIQILVGGTNLNMNGSGASYSSETGWSGTTGGILTSLALPSYQTLIPMNNGASTTNRNCPDISAVASGCVLYANNSSSLIDVGGTSVAAPTWAGFMALVNQQAVAAGKPTVGFANPALYSIAQSNYTANFHDITSGSAGTYSAGTGYDLVTGIGSPNGQTLINSLSNAAGAPTATATGTPTAVVSSSWRVRAGGAAYTDSLNHVWAADENFGGGAQNSSTAAITGALPGAGDQALYQGEHYQNPTLTYTFNVPAGSYQVTLKFAELFDNGSGQRIENITINGTQVLSNFDIFAASGGLDKAIDEVFNNIAPSNGLITISFSAASGSPDGNAKVDALQIVPMPATATYTPTKTNTPTNTLTFTNTPTSTPTATPVVKGTWRIAAGNANAYTDCQNNVWSPDSNYNVGSSNGNTNTITKALPCTTDGALYQKEHWNSGSFVYTFNVPAGSYQTTLKFAEIFDAAAGQRIMNVTINGTQVLTNFDIFADAGGANIADDKVFNNIAPVNGQIVITFTATSSSPDQNCKVDALQIIPQPATPTNTATSTATKVNTATSTMTSTSTSTSTNSSTVSSTPTLTYTLSSTPSFTGTSTWTPSFTPTLTGTFTWTPSNSPTVALTNTATAASTSTSTSTAGNTSTTTSTSTLTPVPPKNTATSTLTSTNTPVNTSTATVTNSSTAVPPTATNTNTSLNTATLTNTVTSTASFTPTSTWTKSFTPTATVTNTWTNSFTPVPPTATATWTKTFTAVPPTSTATFSFTPTKTNTPTNTAIPPTKTNTPLPPTATATSASACSGVPTWNGNFVYYAAGTKVTYNGELYSCIQAHTSEPNWMPSVVPALWKDLGSCNGTAAVVNTSSVIQSAVAGPNVSRNFQPVKFYVQLNQAAQVQVDIYTTLGQRVAGTTFFGNSGMNSWLWDVRNASESIAASGLYVYTVRVTVNGNTEMKTGKVVLLH